MYRLFRGDGDFRTSRCAWVALDRLSSPVTLFNKALTIDDFKLLLGLSSAVTLNVGAVSALSTRRRFGQLAPQLIVRRNPPSPRPTPAILEGWGEEDTRIWARVGLVCPKGVVVVEPLREKRSQSSTAGSARGDLRVADSRLPWTADAIDLEHAAGDDTGEELRALFDPRFRGIGDMPYMGFCFVSHSTFSCGLASSSSRVTSESPMRSRQARRPTGVLRWLMGSDGTLRGRDDTASC